MAGSPGRGALEAYGWDDRWAARFAEAVAPEAPDAGGRAGVQPGRVVRHDATAVAVALPGGLGVRPLRRGLRPRPVVGDWVVERAGTLVSVLPRSSLLERHSVRRSRPQPVAANVDRVLAVCGLDRPVKPGRIQRIAALAWDAGAVPSVVLAKADLVDEATLAAIVSRVEADQPGLDVLVTSATTGRGIDRLRAAVAGATVVLLGESGAGKSSLVNNLLGQQAAATGAVRAGDAKGRHTTTTRQLHPVPGGGIVIDTPGIRAVGLWVDTDAVASTFEDIEELAAGCRFNDCRHDGEPGCAVRAAVDAGRLTGERVESWRALEREALPAGRPAGQAGRRRHERAVPPTTRGAARGRRRT